MSGSTMQRTCPSLILLLAMALVILSTSAMAQQRWETSPIFEETTAAGGFIARSGINSRVYLQEPAPQDFSWDVTLRLIEGRAAGFLFWANPDTDWGYTVYADARRNKLTLSKIAPWPAEQRLDEVPLLLTDSDVVRLRIVASSGIIRVYNFSDTIPAEIQPFPVLETIWQPSYGNRAGIYMVDSLAEYEIGDPYPTDPLPPVVRHRPTVGNYFYIYNPGIDEGAPWYINDHCFIRDDFGLWHLYGITHAQPADPLDERNFAHASAHWLTQRQWQKHPYALTYSPEQGESQLWAPHVIKKDNLYYMFYCAGSLESNWKYRIHLATSTDMYNWTRHSDNPLFMDYYDARDPMVLQFGDLYVMYYTANMDTIPSNHIVALRTSRDLINWSPARVAYVDPTQGSGAGPTESPFVVHYGEYFYLFIGPADDQYHRTAVFRSTTPFWWNASDRITDFPSHAAEVVQDVTGSWYVSDCGWDLNGVRLAPMEWYAPQEWSFE